MFTSGTWAVFNSGPSVRLSKPRGGVQLGERRRRREAAEARFRMSISARQIRTALQLLGWTSEDLAKRSRVSFVTALRAQADTGPQSIPGADLWAMQRAIEAAGTEFIHDNTGAVGVRLRKST